MGAGTKIETSYWLRQRGRGTDIFFDLRPKWSERVPDWRPLSGPADTGNAHGNVPGGEDQRAAVLRASSEADAAAERDQLTSQPPL